MSYYPAPLSRRRRRGGTFSPADLFAAGEQGFWYDPSDLTTLFQDAAGVTPVTAVEQPVRLMLDKSKGLTVGDDISSAWQYSSFSATRTSNTFPSTATATANANFGFIRNSSLQANYYYDFTISWSNNTSGLTLFVGDGSLNASIGNAVAGTVTGRFRASTTPIYIFAASGAIGNSFTVNSFSIREVAGNHATASADARRPVLSARVNQLERTEDLSVSPWSQTTPNVTLVPAAATAPNGTTTATLMYPSTSGTFREIWQNSTMVAGVQYRQVYYVKAAGFSACQILFNAAYGGSDIANFDLTNGTVGTVVSTTTGVTASIVGVGNGWYRISATFTGIATSLFRAALCIVPNATSARGASVTANGTDGILVWGADLRVTNDGVGLPAYQRVTTATDYDTTGFPRYLRFDGTDDCLFTGNVDFATVTSDGLARRNLLLVPSQFDDAAWTKTGVTVTPNTTTAPDGTLTADKIVEGAVSGVKRVSQVVGTASVAHTITVYAKADERSWLYIERGGTHAAYFDLTLGAVGNLVGAGTTASITSAGNGWYRCQMGATTTTTTTLFATATGNGGASYTGDGTSGLYLWGAQVEAGTTATAYQNIGTDKVTVCAGVRKLSDTAVGTLIGFAASSIVDGAFGISAPNSAGVNSFGAYSRGTTTRTNNLIGATYAAPVTGVVSMQASISAPSINLSFNGVPNVPTTTSQGTGNYANAPLFIGARNDTIDRLTGRLYQLIGRGALSDAVDLANTEAYVNDKTKAF